MLRVRRLGPGVARICTAANGLPINSFRYHWDDAPQVGFMADEAARLQHEAVAYDEASYGWVNYDGAGR